MFAKIIDFVVENAVKYSFQALGGVFILVSAWILSRFVAKMTEQALQTRKVDVTIIKFLVQAVRIVILALGVLMTLSSFGVQIAPLIAGLSVAGVGIGLAIQGPLSNYAAGATLIFTKPFKVSDIIEVHGYQGEVADISLPRTELKGLDGSRIIIPNKHIIGEVIKNYSEYRKLDIHVGVSYDTNIDDALAIMKDIISSSRDIPDIEVYRMGIDSFADSAIVLQVSVWVHQDKYVDVKFAINKSILDRFRAKGIIMPFPQRDVHLYQHTKTS